MVLENEGDYPSRWAAITSISAKIGCVPQTLSSWIKRKEVDSGARAGVPTDVADKMKAKAELGWNPQFDDLEFMVRTAWRWLVKNRKLGAKG